MTNKEAAIQYAANGWPVFPLHHVNADGVCSCGGQDGCKPGKHPRLYSWPKAVCDLAQVHQWWEEWPDANIGMRLEGLTVLDVDVSGDKQGAESLRKLEAAYEPLDKYSRLRQRSGSGGVHEVYKDATAVGMRRKLQPLYPDLELFVGSGAYIVVEPSLHILGGRYKWTDTANPLNTHRDQIRLAEPPSWLLSVPSGKQAEKLAKVAKARAARKSLDTIFAEALERIKAGEARHLATMSMLGISKVVGYSRDESLVRLSGWVDAVNALILDKSRRFTMRECEACLRYVYNKEAVEEEGDTSSKKTNIAAILEELCGDVELFHSPKGEAFALVPMNDHVECRLLDSKVFKSILTYRFYKRQNSTPGREALQSFVDFLSARATYEGPEREVSIRFAHKDGRAYLDLGNAAWQVVEIDATGWRILPQSPVPFRRVAGMKALPVPASGGSLTTLRRFCNLQLDKHFVQAVAWLLSCFLPRGSYPVLLIMGGQGTVKSGTTSILRSVLDPATISLSALPRDERDLAIACNNSGIVAFDNISTLPAWLSDAFCRVASGGGFRTRTLTTDSDEQLFDTRRPLVLNGIDDLASRADLLDRGIGLYLRRVLDTQRKTDDEVLTEFAAAHAGILGALLTGVSAAIRNLPNVKTTSLPRMSDFARFAIAGEEGLGLEPGAFMQAYMEGRQLAAELNVENDVVAQALLRMIQGRNPRIWEGTAKDLLVVLSQQIAQGLPVPLEREAAKGWPSTPAGMGRWLRRAEPGLLAVGIHISEWRGKTAGRVRMLRIEYGDQSRLVLVPDQEAG